MKEQAVESLELIYLHVFVVPLNLWVDQYHFAYNNAVLESKSAGFIRIAPKASLLEVRQCIANQLGQDIIPKDFVFLRSVGRCLAVVKQNQEVEMRAREFVPPATFSPELLLLPSTHEDVQLASTKKFSQNCNIYKNYDSTAPGSREISSSESDDVPFSKLENNGEPSLETINNNLWNLNDQHSTEVSAVPDANLDEMLGGGEGFAIYNKGTFKKKRSPTLTGSGGFTNTEENTSTDSGNSIPEATSPQESASFPGYTSPTEFSKQPRNDTFTTRSRSSLKSRDTPGLRPLNSFNTLISTDIAVLPATGSAIGNKSVTQKAPDATNNVNLDVINFCGNDDSDVEDIKSPDINKQQNKQATGEALMTTVVGDPSNKHTTKHIAEDQKKNEEKPLSKNFVEAVGENGSGQTSSPNNDVVGKESANSEDEIKARRIALEAKMKARFEKENKRLEEEHLLTGDLSEEKEKELISQVEELRKMNSSRSVDAITSPKKPPETVKKSNSPSRVAGTKESKEKTQNDSKKRRSDERKLRELKNEEQERIKHENGEKKKLEVEKLKAKIEEVKTEKHSLQRSREVNGKKMRNLQNQLSIKTTQINNQWKKKYEEERKQTVILEDKLKKLHGEVDSQHRKLISRSSLIGKPKDVHSKGAPSERSNQRNIVLRLQNEIEQLKMTINLTNKKLVAEKKMKQFAVQDLKELRNKAIESKINAALAKKTLSPPGT